MASPSDSNRQSRMVWVVLVILGAVLCIVGWYRYMM